MRKINDKKDESKHHETSNNLKTNTTENIEKSNSFIRENVLENNSNMMRTVLFIILSAMIFGIVACITFFWAKPYIETFFGKDDAVGTVSDTTKSTEEIISESSGGNVLPTEAESEGSNLNEISPEDKVINSLVKIKIINKSSSEDKQNTEIADEISISTGVILSKGEKITILTDYTKPSKSDEINAIFCDGTEAKAVISNSSKIYGISILTIDKKNISKDTTRKIEEANFSTDELLENGMNVIYAGFDDNSDKCSVMKGNLLNDDGRIHILDGEIGLLLTNIPQENVSGGILANEHGNIIGICLGSLIFENNAGGIQAADIDNLASFINKLKIGKEIAYIGINGSEVTDAVRENIDKDMPYGIYISSIEADSPAYLTGMLNGDIVVYINGLKTLTMEEYMKALKKCEVGDKITITVMRKGKDGYKKIDYSVELSSKK